MYWTRCLGEERWGPQGGTGPAFGPKLGGRTRPRTALSRPQGRHYALKQPLSAATTITQDRCAGRGHRCPQSHRCRCCHPWTSLRRCHCRRPWTSFRLPRFYRLWRRFRRCPYCRPWRRFRRCPCCHPPQSFRRCSGWHRGFRSRNCNRHCRPSRTCRRCRCLRWG
jgi:hypothetical protein